MPIYTGPARNLIKQKILNPTAPINKQNILKLTGINDLPLHIRTINYASKCLEIENHCYSFKSTNILAIPARKVTFYVRIKNTEKMGYIPRLHIKDGIYVGDAVVKNHKGKAY